MLSYHACWGQAPHTWDSTCMELGYCLKLSSVSTTQLSHPSLLLLAILKVVLGVQIWGKMVVCFCLCLLFYPPNKPVQRNLPQVSHIWLRSFHFHLLPTPFFILNLFSPPSCIPRVTHTHIHTHHLSLSICVRTFIGIMYCISPDPKPNHPN